MLALLQLLLPERSTKQRVAVLIHPIGEVLTGHADAGSFPALKLCIIDKDPFLHCSYASTDVLGGVHWGMQGRCANHVRLIHRILNFLSQHCPDKLGCIGDSLRHLRPRLASSARAFPAQ